MMVLTRRGSEICFTILQVRGDVHDADPSAGSLACSMARGISYARLPDRVFEKGGMSDEGGVDGNVECGYSKDEYKRC